MSWKDTKCPCGGKKERETMLCSDCITDFTIQDRRELREYMDPSFSLDYRRHAARILLALARKRGGRYVDWHVLGTYARSLPEAS